ncbi:MAG: 30S ribosomal protein S17 [Bdellovibrionota bacterium]
MTTEEVQKPKKSLQTIRGVVVSDKMDKTRVIEINRRIKHKLYHKQVIRHDRLKVHDEKNESKMGDLIEVVSCRPLSKEKHFRLQTIIEKGKVS